MIAVLKHELRIYFHSLTAYIFGAFLLVFVGLWAMLYNLEAAVSNFEYVLGSSTPIFIIIVPILTMRIIAEERKQKTDQLLYSLPVSTTEIVLGKYCALLLVYAIPLGIVATYPLIFSQYGEVYLLTAYGSLVAFFLLGAALLAVGVFISSLTENQGFAAGIGIAVILLNYFSVSLANYISSTAIGSIVAIFVITILLVWLIRYLTKNDFLAYGVGLLLVLGTLLILLFDEASLEGLLPDLMQRLSLFACLDTFINGMFDLTAIVYFLSVSIFFLFLTVQSLEKRRYN